jgi:hypothetical protein
VSEDPVEADAGALQCGFGVQQQRDGSRSIHILLLSLEMENAGAAGFLLEAAHSGAGLRVQGSIITGATGYDLRMTVR